MVMLKVIKPFYNFSEKRIISPGDIAKWSIDLFDEYCASIVMFLLFQVVFLIEKVIMMENY